MWVCLESKIKCKSLHPISHSYQHHYHHCNIIRPPLNPHANQTLNSLGSKLSRRWVSTWPFLSFSFGFVIPL
jgi:hypothetical protein